MTRRAGPALRLIQAGRELAGALNELQFSPPVTHVYNPLTYARECYELYLGRFADTPKKVLFLGMNPGPFGMVQTGIPFGEVNAVRGWLGLTSRIGRPPSEHPRRPILGFECPRCEVSGQRLWGLFANRFGRPNEFFRHHLVLNYCPLAFLESSGKNRTPDKLPAGEKERLLELCDRHLAVAVSTLEPEWVVGVGDFAWKRATEVLSGAGCRIGKVLHPSPASPAANRDWAAVAERQLMELGIWETGSK